MHPTTKVDAPGLPARLVARLVIFDLDGTLVDSLPDIARALNLALGERGLAPLDAAIVQTLVGEGVVRLAEKALAVAGADAAATPAVADRVRDIYRREPCVATRVYPGVIETLAGLRSRGAHLALLTNKPGEVTRPLLAALGLDQHLDAIIGDGDGHPRKPDPAAVHALMARFGTTPGETLMVGDGIPDMQVARAAGIRSAAALWGYTPESELRATQPDRALTDPRELLA